MSPIGDLPEGQARELLPVFKEHGQEAAVALYREVKELRGERKVTAADLAEARKVLPQRLAGPEQVRHVLAVAAAEGRVPRLAPPAPQPPAQRPRPGPAADEDEGVGKDQADEGAEAIATLERAVAQQEQIYDAVPASVLAAALLYDSGRAEHLRHRLRQLASRTAYRTRDPRTDSGNH
ncbi:hypothetical protein [Streptomyces fradiae]|uniref:hypothetical protein n=1 Tax=Streptomyces fradiae TaxID=1906 RepID=UPI00381420E4